MYKLLLCFRYLRTRYLALVCIISIMLGVATLIVVNSVMAGFSTKLKQRLHGILSDIIVEAYDLYGFANPDAVMDQIRKSDIGDKIEMMTPTIEIPGMMQFNYTGLEIPPKFVKIIGIDPEARAKLGGFSEFLMDTRNRTRPSFALSSEAEQYHEKHYPPLPPLKVQPAPLAPGETPPPDEPPLPQKKFAGMFLGFALSHYRVPDSIDPARVKEVEVIHPGDEVVLHTIAGQGLRPVYDSVIVADFFKSEMSENDSTYIFVPLEWLQNLRSMTNRATHLQIKLKDYKDAVQVKAALHSVFAPQWFSVQTWEDRQGALLAAISIEKGILNVLLFLIIGVAGFGILAIFSMIVVEKTRDIGILKALGASNAGVMKIFLGYGLLLGIVGAGMGTTLGLILALNINTIEKELTKLCGIEIFNRSVYYFDKIPTDVQSWSVFLVNIGAVAIAVLFSVLPALRAAMLHPVRALRYE
jgi:lipoprotein-releasing system permease protein